MTRHVHIWLTVTLLSAGLAGQAPDVQLIRPEVGPLEHVLTFDAEIAPFEQTQLMSRIDGYVDRVTVEEGDVVSKGDVLVLLVAPELQAAVDSATAELAIAQARSARLAAELEQARIGVEAAKAELVAARAATALAQARLDEAVAFASFRTIRCPMEQAVVVGRTAQTGSLVVGGETGLLTIADVRSVRLRFWMSGEGVALAGPGTRVRVMQPERSSEVYPAEISRFHGVPRRGGAARTAEVEMDNGDGRWQIGSVCKVEVQLLELDEGMTLPEIAVSRGFDGSHVWIMQNGKAERRAVGSGAILADRILITSGLDGHEGVILRPPPNLSDRSTVNPRVASSYGRQLVHGESPETRLLAAMTIGQFGALAVDLVPELINATGDADNRVVREAITALGMIGSPAREAIPVLDELTGRDDRQISERARAALRLIRRR